MRSFRYYDARRTSAIGLAGILTKVRPLDFKFSCVSLTHGILGARIEGHLESRRSERCSYELPA